MVLICTRLPWMVVMVLCYRRHSVEPESTGADRAVWETGRRSIRILLYQEDYDSKGLQGARFQDKEELGRVVGTMWRASGAGEGKDRLYHCIEGSESPPRSA